MGEAVGFVFDGIAAYNALMFIFIGLVLFAIGAGLAGYWLSWRLRSFRVDGNIVGVYSSGEQFTDEEWLQRAQTKKKAEEISARNAGKDFFSGLKDDFGKHPVRSLFASLIVLMFCAIPFVFLGMGAWMAYDYISLRNEGVSTTAQVVDIREYEDSDSGTTYAPVVEFADAGGRLHRNTDKVSTGGKSGYRVGQTVSIYYDADDPERFILDRFWRYMGISLIFMAAGGGIICFFGVYGFRRTSPDKPLTPEAARRKVEKEKKNYWAAQTYTPVFSFQIPGEGKLEMPGTENASNWLMNKLPGTPVRLMVRRQKDGTFVVKRPGLFLLLLGLVFLGPGVVLLSIGLPMLHFSPAAILLLFAFLGVPLWRVWQKVPKDIDWREIKNVVSQGEIVSVSRPAVSGFLLEPQEIRERMKAMQSAALATGVILIIVGAGMGAGGFYLAQDLYALSAQGARSPGKVVEMRSRSTDDGYVYYPVVQFEADGKKVKFSSKSASNPPIYERGQAVSVLYDPQDTERAMIDRGWMNWLLSGGLGLGGLLLFLYGLQMYGAARSRARRI